MLPMWGFLATSGCPSELELDWNSYEAREQIGRLRQSWCRLVWKGLLYSDVTCGHTALSAHTPPQANPSQIFKCLDNVWEIEIPFDLGAAVFCSGHFTQVQSEGFRVLKSHQSCALMTSHLGWINNINLITTYGGGHRIRHFLNVTTFLVFLDTVKWQTIIWLCLHRVNTLIL